MSVHVWNSAFTCDTRTLRLVAELEEANTANHRQVCQDAPCLWRRHNLTYHRLQRYSIATEEPR